MLITSRGSKWIVRILAGALVLDGVLLAAGLTYQYFASLRDRQRFPPAGQRMDLGGYALHLSCLGQSGPEQPTVILDAGAGH
jgi:hypothetical protein